jgi:hypothetical protein
MTVYHLHYRGRAIGQFQSHFAAWLHAQVNACCFRNPGVYEVRGDDGTSVSRKFDRLGQWERC